MRLSPAICNFCRLLSARAPRAGHRATLIRSIISFNTPPTLVVSSQEGQHVVTVIATRSLRWPGPARGDDVHPLVRGVRFTEELAGVEPWPWPVIRTVPSPSCGVQTTGAAVVADIAQDARRTAAGSQVGVQDSAALGDDVSR